MSLVLPSDHTDLLCFQPGKAGRRRGTSYDLRIGAIINEKGESLGDAYPLQPNQMVHVISQEVFNLPRKLTGHVTYKTGMTQRGIWALTVGILDPGWDGPLATTLLNFSCTDYLVRTGEEFLRVSFFEHEAVAQEHLVKAGTVDDYHRKIQKVAAEHFPATFLDTHAVADRARRLAVGDITRRSVAAAAVIAVGLALASVVSQCTDRAMLDDYLLPANDEFRDMRTNVDDLTRRVTDLERSAASVGELPPGGAPRNPEGPSSRPVN